MHTYIYIYIYIMSNVSLYIYIIYKYIIYSLCHTRLYKINMIYSINRIYSGGPKVVAFVLEMKNMFF